MDTDTERFVRLGEVSGVYGIQGWVKIHSFTEPRTNLIDFSCWLLDHEQRQWPVEIEAARTAGKHLIAKIGGIDDRDAARALIGAGIGVARSALPACAPGEYYWADLEGLRVRNVDGHEIGRVERLMATGANDVLVLDGDRMIPFVSGQTIVRVDLEGGEIIVDWDPSYWE